ncbi:hypothetical protein [Rummeliibacillus stabekisii]|uniref:hypothetical protein n=1 Tax=Rummeliibacillus stabekisii TaxID=241244 RepID=UPI00371D6001
MTFIEKTGLLLTGKLIKREKVEDGTLHLYNRIAKRDLNRRYKAWNIPLEEFSDNQVYEVKIYADTGVYVAHKEIAAIYGKVFMERDRRYVALPLRYFRMEK